MNWIIWIFFFESVRFFVNRDYCIQLSSSQNESDFLIIGVDPGYGKNKLIISKNFIRYFSIIKNRILWNSIFSKISNDIWNGLVHLVEVSVIIGYYYNNRIKGNETNFSSYTGTNWNFYDIEYIFDNNFYFNWFMC